MSEEDTSSRGAAKSVGQPQQGQYTTFGVKDVVVIDRNVSTVELSLTPSNTYAFSALRTINNLTSSDLFTPSTMFVINTTANATPDQLLAELSTTENKASDVIRSSEDADACAYHFEEVSLDDGDESMTAIPTDSNHKKEKKRPKMFSIVISKPSPPSSASSSPPSPVLSPPAAEPTLQPTALDADNASDRLPRRQSSGPFYTVPMTPMISMKDVSQTAKSQRLSVDGPFTKTNDSSSLPQGTRSRSLTVLETERKGQEANHVMKRSNSHKGFFSWRSQTINPLDRYVSKTRQRDLPPKTPKEEKRHLQEHEAMMRRAKRADEKRMERERKRKEQRDMQYREALHKWEHEIIPNWQTARHEKTTRELWWQGIPPRCRSKVWNLCIGNSLAISKGTFEMCLDRAFHVKSEITDGLGSPTRADLAADMVKLFESIEEEISTTLPALGLFQPEQPLCESLRNVLEAYTFFQPEHPYVFGIGNLAAMLLLNMDATESFIAMVNLSKRPCLAAFLHMEEKKIQGYQRVFFTLLKSQIPKLYEHFKSINLYPSLFLDNWIATLFTSHLAFDISTRVWDCYFLQGDIFLFQMSIAILFSLEAQLYGTLEESIKTLLAKPFSGVGVENAFDYFKHVQFREEEFRQLVVKEVLK